MSIRRPQAVQLPPEDFLFSSRRELQSGGFARVFAIKYRDEEVAVKVPHATGLSEEEEEIASLTAVAHRNIVQFYGTVRYDERVCLVFELAPKGSVRDLLDKGPLQLLRASRQSWILDIARGIRYMHSEAPVPLVHGDLKGGNVLIFDASGGTIAKVSDFGQSRPLFNTTVVQQMGTHLWSAPEVLAAEGHSQKSDVWSFGCTAVELVSEREPYHHRHGGDPREVKKILRRVEERETDPLSGLEATWPPRLLKVVQRCLHRQHQHRPNMEAVLHSFTAEDDAVGEVEERRPQEEATEELEGAVGPAEVKKSKKNKDGLNTLLHSCTSVLTDGKKSKKSKDGAEGKKAKKTKLGVIGEPEEIIRTAAPPPAHSDSAARLKALYFSSWSASGDLEVQIFDLRTETTFQEARNSARGLFRHVPPRARSIFISEEGQHVRDGELRPCVGYFDKDSDRHPDVDMQDGRKVLPDCKTCTTWRFLDDRSELPRSPRLAPHIIIYNDAELLQMDARATKAAPVGALRQERFCAFLWGVKCGLEQPQFFWRITESGEGSGAFVSPEGNVFGGPKSITGAQERHHFFLLLQDNDQLPVVELPEGRTLDLRHRLGAEVDIRKGRLVVSPAPAPADLERWVTPADEESDFHEKLSGAVNRRRALTMSRNDLAGDSRKRRCYML